MRRDRREVVKPNNTKKSLKQVLSLLADYKLKLSFTFICAVISTLFTIISPLLIGQATTTIYDGIVQIMNHTGSIDFEKLYDEGIRGLIFDIDNTLADYRFNSVHRQCNIYISAKLVFNTDIHGHQL